MNVEKVDVLHAVTSPISLVLMRGQMSYLENNGFRVAALCSPGPQVEEARSLEDVPIHTIPMQREISPLADVVSLIRIIRLLRRLRPTICNAGTPKAGLLVGLAAWLNRVPCRIYTLRGLRLETATGLKRAVLALTERIACACAHRVVCVSPSLRERAIELDLTTRKKTLVLASGSSNGVDVSRFTPTPEQLVKASELRTHHGVAESVPVIGFVGRLTNDKGISELVSAFQRVKNDLPLAVLMLIGSFEPGDPVTQATRTAIVEGDGILQIDFVPDVALCYLMMDVLVLPTHREGFPNTALEAAAAGKPVITTTATGAIDSVVPGVTGLLVPVGDSEALANALREVLLDPARAGQMGAAGRKRIETRFEQKIVWSSLAGLYFELLKEQDLPVPSPRTCDAASI